MSKNNTRTLGEAPWLHVIISTGFGTGFFPFGPGTAGAFVALLIWIGLYFILSPMMLALATAALIIGSLFVGVWTDNVMERYWGADPRAVVIDEYFGTWVAVIAALFYDGPAIYAIGLATLAFALFRIIDITKPLGCRWVDTHIHGGWGCMLDDALAGFYSAVITLVVRFLFLPMISSTNNVAFSPEIQSVVQSVNTDANYHGIDVSNHQGDIDWTIVRKDTLVKFVYIKASEGATHVDKRYRKNIESARKEGLLVGSYHYFRMTSSAHSQYNHIIGTMKKDEQDLVPMIDVETTDNHPVGETQDSLRVLLELVEKYYGVKPMIYGTNRSFNTICGADFKGYNAYIGRYGKNEPVLKGSDSYHYYIWQWTETGKVNGIEKGVDLWRFHKNADVSEIFMSKNCKETPKKSKKPTANNMSITEKDGLVIYTPHYKRIDLVCGKRPTGNEANFLMACEAAFTGELLKEFKHSNIAGNHVSKGQLYKGYSCKANTGCFAWYGDKNEWTFAVNDYNKYVVEASKRNGMAFGQVMLIHNGKVQSKKPQNMNSVNYYRVLAELDNRLCIIDSKGQMRYGDFENALVKLKVKHALYMDMGAGWNYSFYRDNDDKVQYIHKKFTPYATNWIVFEK